jgi:diguanylate cyclase (GGDEF)-like protein/PAS domain S-box-containing protein
VRIWPWSCRPARLACALKDNLPIGIYRADEEGYVQTANPALLKMLGFDSFEAFYAVELEDIWVDVSQREELIGRMRREGAVTDFEARLRRTDGREIWGLFHSFGVFDEGGRLLYFDTTVQDVTEKKEALEALARMARTDGLTGLSNRQHLLARLEEEVVRANRYGRPLAFLLLDLDHFKSVNDRRGHLTGDRVLAAAGRAIGWSLRSADSAGRYGGEEFCVVLPETAREDAQALAERLRLTLGKIRHSAGEGKTIRVTCSIGVGSDRGGRLRASDLLSATDQALYEAKRLGRNRVAVARSKA